MNQQHRHPDGRPFPVENAPTHRDNLDTYQALLDEALQLTFPASDPVCAHAATRCADPCETASDKSDWRLHPGSLDATDGAAR